MSLFDKYASLENRLSLVMKLIGRDPLGVKFDDIISPVRGKIGDQEIILAGSNNYLGLTFDPDCMKAAQDAVSDHGTGTTGSRVANGSYTEHVDLEAAIAEHLGMPSCIIFSTGYQTNLAAIGGLTNEKDVIFMDADAHACIIDGTRLTGASTCLLYTSPSPRDRTRSRMPSSA